MPNTDVKCNHCGRSMPYGKDYLVIDWRYMTYEDMEEHSEREAEFCKKCAALILLAVRRHSKT